MQSFALYQWSIHPDHYFDRVVQQINTYHQFYSYRKVFGYMYYKLLYYITNINKCNLKGVKFFATPEWRQFVVDQIQKSDLAKLRVQLLDSWVVETVIRQLKIGRIDKITKLLFYLNI